MPTDLRINLSMNHLEKLLLDETGEIKPEIAQGIAEAFAKRHLSNVFDSSVRLGIINLQEKIKQQVREEFAQSWDIDFTSQKFQDAVKEAATSSFKKEVEKQVRELTRNVECMVIEKVNIHLEHGTIVEYINRVVGNKIDKMIGDIAPQAFAKALKELANA